MTRVEGQYVEGMDVMGKKMTLYRRAKGVGE